MRRRKEAAAASTTPIMVKAIGRAYGPKLRHKHYIATVRGWKVGFRGAVGGFQARKGHDTIYFAVKL